MEEQLQGDYDYREHTNQALVSLASTLSRAFGAELFNKICHHLATALEVDYVFIGELQESKDRVGLVGGVEGGNKMKLPFEYDLKGTPCEQAITQDFCLFPSSVQNHFPRDQLLKDMSVESYMGCPLFSSSGELLGLIVAMDGQPASNVGLAATLMEIFSNRVAAELERLQYEARQQNSDRRTALLVDKLSDGIQENDLDGVITYANATLHRIHGREPGDLVGRHIWDFEPNYEAKQATRDYFYSLVDEQPVPDIYVTKNICKDGREVFLGISWAYSFNADGKLSGFVSVISDVTQHMSYSNRWISSPD